MVSLAYLFAQATTDVNCQENISNGATPNGSPPNCNTGLPRVAASSANLRTLFQVFFGILGAAAVISIILSAIHLAAAHGEPKAVARARNTIIYAVIGLAVALSAEIIVSFVLTHV